MMEEFNEENGKNNSITLFACLAFVPQSGERIFFTVGDFGEGLDVCEFAEEYAWDACGHPGILEFVLPIKLGLSFMN